MWRAASPSVRRANYVVERISQRITAEELREWAEPYLSGVETNSPILPPQLRSMEDPSIVRVSYGTDKDGYGSVWIVLRGGGVLLECLSIVEKGSTSIQGHRFHREWTNGIYYVFDTQ